MTFDNLAAALIATGIPFAEGQWVNAGGLKTDYGVYALDGAMDLGADDHHAERLCEGTVDLFTRQGPGRTEAALVEAALDSVGVPWRVNSVQVEDDTGYTHREWVFQCLA